MLGFLLMGVPPLARAQSSLADARSDYRAGRVAEAAARLRATVRRSPQNGAAWADLGLYEARLGKRDAAIHASLAAARYGAQRDRTNAYYNLWKLGVRAKVPAPATGDDAPLTCVDVQAPLELDCHESATVCARGYDDSGNGGGTSGTNLTVAPHGQEPSDTPERQIPYAESAWVSGKVCDYAWHLEPPWFGALVQRCIATTGGSEPDCGWSVKDALAAAVDPEYTAPGTSELLPLTPAERRRARREQSACVRNLDREVAANTGRLCEPVVYDPCQRRVGMVCDEARLDADVEGRPVWLAAPGLAPRHVAREVSY